MYTSLDTKDEFGSGGPSQVDSYNNVPYQMNGVFFVGARSFAVTPPVPVMSSRALVRRFDSARVVRLYTAQRYVPMRRDCHPWVRISSVARENKRRESRKSKKRSTFSFWHPPPVANNTVCEGMGL